jgi:hypothetical protein
VPQTEAEPGGGGDLLTSGAEAVLAEVNVFLAAGHALDARAVAEARE